nr:YrhK family protein [Candidatus Microthrix sp.]
MFVNRPRQHAVLDPHASDRDNRRWEAINTGVYLVGGVMFVWGSVLFFPAFESRANRGAWIFFIASLMYIAVTAHDLLEVIRHRESLKGTPTIWERIEGWSAAAYLAGSLLFAVGSICFLSSVGMFTAGAVFFIVGSLLFVCAAITFVTGSMLFLVASVPYLFSLQSAADTRTVDAFLATQYVVGSALFLLGGAFNFVRARLVDRGSAARSDHGHAQTM